MERIKNRVGTSVLFALPVRGVGTSQVESLTSYIRRLAEAHVTSPSGLADFLISNGARWASNRAKAIGEGLNGTSTTTAHLINALVERTWVPDVAHTALVGRAEGLAFQQVLRRTRAWCAACLDESEPYDRLVWSLDLYRVCTRHCLLLQEVCAGCERPHPPIDPQVQSARCLHCQRELRSGPRAAAQPTRTERLLEALVARMERGEPIGQPQVQGVVVAAIARTGSAASLARAIGIGKGTLSAYRRGDHRPLLPIFLQLLEPSVSLDAALAMPADAAAPRVQARGPRRRLRPFLRAVAALRRLLAGPDERLLPLRHFSKLHGVSVETLRQRAPAETRELSRRRKAYEGSRRAASERAREERVRAAVRSVHLREGRVVRRAVEMEVGQPGLLRAPYLSLAYRDECARLEVA